MRPGCKRLGDRRSKIDVDQGRRQATVPYTESLEVVRLEIRTAIIAAALPTTHATTYLSFPRSSAFVTPFADASLLEAGTLLLGVFFILSPQ